MTLNNKKMIIVTSILAISIILLLVFMLLGVNLVFFRIPSVSYLLNEYNLVKKVEKELITTQEAYYNTISSLEKAQSEYNKQKNKYNSISDETINIIKEATTEESYNLEYMWIKLGNYAKKNNLEIVMVEPGGQMDSSSQNTNSTTTTSNNASTTANNNTSNTTNTTANNTSNTTTTNTTTTTTTTTNTNTNTTTTTTSGNNTSTENKDNKTSDNKTSDKSNTSSTDSSVLKIQVTGSYMNTADFIFEVENDTALRFKLDNISMDYVKGTTIKTSFNVKNIVVNK